MSQRFCHHINPAGVFCGGPPVNKRDYCFWHLHENGRRMKAARARARLQRVTINLPVLDDLHAVQVGLMQLADAISHGEIDYPSGRLVLGVLRLAASNLKSQHGWHQRSKLQNLGVGTDIVAEYPGFEQDYDLPKGFDLSIAPEEAFPPPQEPAAAAQADESQATRPEHRHRRRSRLSRELEKTRSELLRKKQAKGGHNKAPTEAVAPSAGPKPDNRSHPARKPPQPDSVAEGTQSAASGPNA